MRKVLLLSAAMMTMSLAATAQEAVKFNAENARTAMKAQVAPVAALPCNEMYNSAAVKTARRTIANGVSYDRPDGTFYVSGTSSNKYLYLYIPALADVTFKNYATDKANAKWYVGTTELQEVPGDENNDLTTSFPVVGRGYISSYYIPTLTVGETSYKYADELTPSRVSLINGDSLLSVTQVNRIGGYYYGFSNAAIFGTADRNLTIDEQTVACKRKNVIEFFDKPAAPYCLYSLQFPVVSYNEKYSSTSLPVATDFIPEGKQVTARIIKMTEEGKFTDEILAEIPITSESIQTGEAGDLIKAGIAYGFVEVANMGKDEFDTPVIEPVVIDCPFAIELDGFDQEGVNFSLYMCDVMATERDYYENEGGVEGTCCEYVRKDNGELVEGLYYIQTYPKSSPDNRQYNAVIYLNGMFDYAEVGEEFENMIAPVEGGAVYAEYETTDPQSGESKTVQDPGFYYYTICPRLSDWEGIAGSDNYLFEGLPEWVTIKGFSDDYFADYNVTIANFEAEALPAGEKGRYAQFRVVSDKGAKSKLVTIIQGDAVVPTGIEAVKNAVVAKNTTSAMYNMAGQRVDASFKGLVIKDGKKVVLK